MGMHGRVQGGAGLRARMCVHTLASLARHPFGPTAAAARGQHAGCVPPACQSPVHSFRTLFPFLFVARVCRVAWSTWVPSASRKHVFGGFFRAGVVFCSSIQSQGPKSMKCFMRCLHRQQQPSGAGRASPPPCECSSVAPWWGEGGRRWRGTPGAATRTGAAAAVEGGSRGCRQRGSRAIVASLQGSGDQAQKV